MADFGNMLAVVSQFVAAIPQFVAAIPSLAYAGNQESAGVRDDITQNLIFFQPIMLIYILFAYCVIVFRIAAHIISTDNRDTETMNRKKRMNNLNRQSAILCAEIKMLSWAFFTYVQFEEVLSCNSFKGSFVYSFGLSYDNLCTFAGKYKENVFDLMTWIFAVWFVFSNKIHVLLRSQALRLVGSFGGERFTNRKASNYVYARQAMFITDVFKLLLTAYFLGPILWKFRNNDAGLIFCVLFMAFYHEISTIFNMVNAAHGLYPSGCGCYFSTAEGLLKISKKLVSEQDDLEQKRHPNSSRRH
jgi:hypothetical protein